MAPTLPDHSIIVLERWPFVVSEYTGSGFAYERLNRGDLISLRSPDGTRSFVKRITGVPGDTVRGEEGWISVNGDRDPLHTPLFGPPSIELVLGEGEYFVLGDHRDVSFDSREFGVVRSDMIQSRVTAAFGSGEEMDARSTVLGASTSD